MRLPIEIGVVVSLGIAVSGLLAQDGEGGGRGRLTVWAPVPVEIPAWTAPNKPIVKLADLLAKHRGQGNWSETIVSDNLFQGDYISMAPGVKTPRRFHQDNRAWWIVQDGQIRFEIEGQQPFVASKGYMVQVPHRLVYSMETVGDKPSLRFEVTIANARTMYPIDETPAPVPGQKYIRTTVANVKGAYDKANVPFIDYNATIAGHPVAILTDFNALYQPKLGKKVGLDLMGGIGVAATRFYEPTIVQCSYFGGCINYTSSDHFMEHLGAGIRYYVWHHVFVRPEVHYYHIQNNVEFNSDNVFRVGASIGYTIGGD